MNANPPLSLSGFVDRPYMAARRGAILKKRLHEDLAVVGPDAMKKILEEKITNGNLDQLADLPRAERRRIEKRFNVKIPTPTNNRGSEYSNERLVASKSGAVNAVNFTDKDFSFESKFSGDLAIADAKRAEQLIVNDAAAQS